jgi:sulfoxide reductase heme-binding subunit YedZ
VNIRFAKVAVFLLCLTPAVWLTYALFNGLLGANPVEAVTRQSGLWALKLLLVTLLVTPLRSLTGWNVLVRFRRMLGLFVFFYASCHMLLYLGLDQFFNVNDIIKDIVKRPFITVGFVSFLLLLPLALTSSNKMVKRLGGRRWKQLHKLTYVVSIAACFHYLMLVKADIRSPLIYFALLAILLGYRLLQHSRLKLGQLSR